MDEKKKQDAIMQNLKDAGCSDDFAARFLGASTQGDRLWLLSCQRCRPLARVHDEQQKLDRLDYLRYQMQKPKKNDQ